MELPDIRPIVSAIVICHHEDGATTELIIQPDFTTQQVGLDIEMKRDYFGVDEYDDYLYLRQPRPIIGVPHFTFRLTGGQYTIRHADGGARAYQANPPQLPADEANPPQLPADEG